MYGAASAWKTISIFSGLPPSRAQRIAVRVLGDLARRKHLVQHPQLADALQGERPHLRVGRDEGVQVESAVGERQAVRLDRVFLHPPAAEGVIAHLDAPPIDGGLCEKLDRRSVSLAVGSAFRRRLRLARDDRGEPVEIRLHVGAEPAPDLLERRLEVRVDRRGAARREARPVRVERAQFGQREGCVREFSERLAREPPVVLATRAGFRVEREARILERDEIAPDRPRRHALVARQLGDRDVGRRLDGPQDAPLANDLGVSVVRRMALP